MRDRPIFIGGEIYRRSSYGRKHPLAIPRVSTVTDLCRALGWLPRAAYRESPRATPEELTRFHDADYVRAVMDAERSQSVSDHTRRRYNLGKAENPVFADMFQRPATACGGALLGADLIRDGGVVFAPAGGANHGRRDRASGFCYFNDPVLAMLRLLDHGLAPIVYVDVDAHHGDGVQDAFADDARVFTISVHERERWPFTGDERDRAAGAARNLPMPRGFNDSEMEHVMRHAVLPLVARVGPAALVVQCGADGLEDDPLSRLSLSNRALRAVAEMLTPMAPRLLVLGGGGYNPWSVARCWACVWGALNGLLAPEPPPEPARAVLRALNWDKGAGLDPPAHWLDSLLDPPRRGPVRDEVRRIVDIVVSL